MKKILRVTGSCFFAALLLSSCSSTMYTSNTVNVPLMRERGEIKLNLDQNNFQTAIALANHVAVMTNGFYKARNGSNFFTERGSLLEAGLGYFNSPRRNVVCEVYGGVGGGNVYKRQMLLASDNSTVIADYNINATRFFIQPNIGFTTAFFDLAFSTRFSTLKYAHFISDNYPEARLDHEHLDVITRQPYIFAEPAITARAGYKFLKLQLQFGLSMKLNNAPLTYTPFFGSLGFVADIRN
jgi:hypothetical protein